MEVAIGCVIPDFIKESFSMSDAVWFVVALPRAWEDNLFLDVVPTTMAFARGDTNAQPVLGNMDPSVVSSTVVASSFADDNCTAMGTSACTLKSKVGGLGARRISLLRVPDCVRVLERVRSSTFGPLPLHFFDPLCFVDGLWEADGDAF